MSTSSNQRPGDRPAWRAADGRLSSPPTVSIGIQWSDAEPVKRQGTLRSTCGPRRNGAVDDNHCRQ